jgi:SAM-dependent methyltransferase
MGSFTPGATLKRMTWGKFKRRVLAGLPHTPKSRVRTCGCCGRLSVVLALDATGEAHRCLRCGANLRYELLARYIREEIPNLAGLDVVELDPDSPLRPHLSRAKSYVRTYFSGTETVGSVRSDGARCEDVTRLTLPDQSVDLLVSSEVLEHVPDLDAARREIARVLRPGGRHLFTVPTEDMESTIQRAIIENGALRHLVEPEYHGDPLGQGGGGILSFWTFGWDLPHYFDTAQTSTRPLIRHRDRGGRLLRVVWETVRK